MAFISTVPRRCVNLPAGAGRVLASCVVRRTVQGGTALAEFEQRLAQWLGVPYAFGTSMGRSAFQLALEALELAPGSEIIFPALTFPIIPLVAQTLGYRPVFCDVDPQTFNAGPGHIAAKITERTGAVVATHLFGQPCAITDIVSLAQRHRLRVVEDCAHACGVRVDGRQVGTFGDVGVFSFAEGKNMPCCGGGAIATSDSTIARRAEAILARAAVPATGAVLRTALEVWAKWLFTRPAIFGLTAYPALRFKLYLGQSLMDSVVGEELLAACQAAPPSVGRMANLQAAIGLLQLKHIDAFNEGARRNAQLLTDSLGKVSGIGVPPALAGNHIYVYYPLTVTPSKRDDLRHFLLRHGVDAKITDMCDCSVLPAFGASQATPQRSNGLNGLYEETLLEICVYPVISAQQIRHIAQTIRAWAEISA